MEPSLTDSIEQVRSLQSVLEGQDAKFLVQTTWKVVERDLDAHGVKFFLKIFEIAPPALELFSFKGAQSTRDPAALLSCLFVYLFVRPRVCCQWWW
jgi:hypothetical protein